MTSDFHDFDLQITDKAGSILVIFVLCSFVRNLHSIILVRHVLEMLSPIFIEIYILLRKVF